MTFNLHQQSEIVERVERVRDAMGGEADPELRKAVDAVQVAAQTDGATPEAFWDTVQKAFLAAAASAATTAVFQALTALLPVSLGF